MLPMLAEQFIEHADFGTSLVISLIIAAISTAVQMVVANNSKPKGPKPDSNIQMPTQDESEPFLVVFGTPARNSRTHVLYYGYLVLEGAHVDGVKIGYHYILTVHLGLCRGQLDSVQQIWYKDTPIWPSLRDETDLAADGTILAYLDGYECFGGNSRDGGILGTVDILYGTSTQGQNEYLQKGLAAVTGAANIRLLSGIYYAVSPVFAAQPDGYWVGGKFTNKGYTVAVVAHTGDTLTLNDGNFFWLFGNDVHFTLEPSTAAAPHGPAYRGITSLVFRHTYWGISSILGLVSYIGKRTLHLTDGGTQWYVAKADINGDLNPAHILRECLTDPTWGEGMADSELGTSWTDVADTLYTEGFGLSFVYAPKPGALQDFVDTVLEHIDGFLYLDRETGLVEIGLCRDDYEISYLETFDSSDFEVVDWHTPSWHDIPGRVQLSYGNRYWPENGKSVIYDDIAVQAKQAGRVNESAVERPGIFSDNLATMVANRIGRSVCRLLSLGSLRAKRTMSHLHKGSVFVLSYTDPELMITQMVVRVLNIKYGKLGSDEIELDVVEDVWSSAFTIYGTPTLPSYVDTPDDANLSKTGYLSTAAIIENGAIGLGTDGDMPAAATITGEWAGPSNE